MESYYMQPQKWINHLSISIFAITRLRTILTIYRTYFLIRVKRSEQIESIYGTALLHWMPTTVIFWQLDVLHHKEKQTWKWRPDYNGTSLGRLIHHFSSLAYFNITWHQSETLRGECEQRCTAKMWNAWTRWWDNCTVNVFMSSYCSMPKHSWS